MKKRLAIWAGIVGAVLLIPYSFKLPWTTSDYIFAGIVLFALATIYESVTKNMQKKLHRLIVAGVILFVIVLIIGWAAA